MNIEINGYKWKVESVSGEHEKMHPDADTYYLGLTEQTLGVIYIRNDMTKYLTRSTVIHELIHAFRLSYGYQLYTEENVCEFFGAQGDSIIRLADDIMREIGE